MEKIAIIGTGIAGMACAFRLCDSYEITVYEKNDYVGGHTNTAMVLEDDREIPVDTGFMVFNDRTYPNLINLFAELEVTSMDTSMSFGINDTDSDFESSFSTPSSFFAQRKSILSPKRWKLFYEIQRFFKSANKFLNTQDDIRVTLKGFLEERSFNRDLIELFILPMTSAIWSTPPNKMLEYPAVTLFRFMKNHGMLGLGEQFLWRTVKGGSQQYKEKILEKIGPFVTTENGAISVTRKNLGASVLDSNGQTKEFDKVIFATHADQALALLNTPTQEEERLLGSFAYNINPVILHSDASVMPRAKAAWSSWNYRYETIEGKKEASTHYWMNSLQNVSDKKDYFVSVDYKGNLEKSLIHRTFNYEHPRFDVAAIEAQKELPSLNKSGDLFYCGSYFRYGFHEDALTSALDVCSILDAKKPVSI